MKKLSFVLSLLVMLAMFLAACQPAAPAAPAAEQPAAEEPAAEQPAAEEPAAEEQPAGKPFEGQSLTFLTIQPHTVASENLAKWFEEETGAKVEVIVVPYDNVIEKAVLDVTSGANEVDVVDYWYPGLGALVENNVLENLDQWYVENGEELKIDDFYPEYFDIYTKIGESRYGLPYDGDMHVLWYNKTLLAKYNFEPPATWDEYLNICKTITEGEKGEAYGCAIMGAKIPMIIIGSFLNRMGPYGGSFFDAEGNPNVNNPENVAALTDLIEQTKYSLPTASATAFDEALGGWFTGKAAMVEFWTDLGSMTQDPNSSKIVDQWGVVALPKGPGEKGRVAAPINAGFAMGVSTGSQNKELAYAFLKFAARPDVAARYNSVVGGIDPVRKSTLEDPVYIDFVGEEVAAAINDAHANTVAWPTNADWFKLQEPLTDNLSLALTGEKTPQEALDDTQAAWEEILGQ